jgi:hypothetical protein
VTRAIAAGLIAIGALGCVAGSPRSPVSHMREVPYVNPVPGPDEAMVIFLRYTASAQSTSLFEVPEHGPARMIATLVPRNKLAHTTTPGRHTFMVIGGGSTDFIGAELEAGKVYYVLVAYRLQTFREFSLQPIQGAEREQFRSWLADSKWVETTHASLTWAHENAAEIEEQRAKYFPRWKERPASERRALRAEDGQ